MWAGWLDATLVELPPEQAANPVTRRRFADQWSAVQPALPCGARRRELPRTRGIAPLSAGGTVYSDEREILDAERDYWQPRVAVHFGAKLLQWAMFDFGQGMPRVLVVLNPTARKQTLRALDMRATVDREEFFEFQHGDGRLKLIERLAAAYRAGELPDYMLEFVDSLRTRATPAPPDPPHRERSPCPQDLSPRSCRRSAATPNGLFSSDFRCFATATTSSPSVSGRCSVVPANSPICRPFEGPKARTLSRPLERSALRAA